MARNKLPVILPIEGLDSSAPGEYIDDRATPNCQNMFINRAIIGKRHGTSALGASLGERVLSMPELKQQTVTYVYRIGPTLVELLNKTTNTWGGVTGTPMTGIETDRISYAFPLLNGDRVLTFTNGVDAIRKHTGVGNTADLGGSPPVCRYMIDYSGYLVVAYVTSGGNLYSMRVQWCDTGDIETWAGGNSGSKDLIEDGFDITAINIFGNYISVHKESSIYLGYLVSSSEVIHFDRKNNGSGTVCFATVVNLPTGEQIYLSRDGLRLFNGVSSPLITAPVNDEIRESLNPENTYRSWAKLVENRSEYWLGIPKGSNTEPDTIYKYNYLTGKCFKDYRQNICSIGSYRRTNDKSWDDHSGTWDTQSARWDDITNFASFPELLFGKSDGSVTQNNEDLLSDAGTAINAFWESKDYETKENTLGRWQRMKLWARGNSVLIEYSIDAGVTWMTIGTVTLSSDFPPDDDPIFLYFDFVSSKTRVKFSNNETNKVFEIKQFVLEYSVREYIR